MSEDDLKKVFSRNLNRFLAERDLQASDLSNDLKIAPSTISNWCTGLKMPRTGSIDRLAKYFGVNRSDLLTEPRYTNPETQKIAEEIFRSKELRLLFDASRDAEPDDLKMVYDMLTRLKRREQRS